MDPETRIRSYLDANKGSLQYATIDQIVQQVKLWVFYGSCPIPDDAVRMVVARWAIFNPVWVLPGPPPGDGATAPAAPGPLPPSRDSELLDGVKRAIQAFSDGVTVKRGAGSVNVGVTGATAKLSGGDSSASVSVSWGGTLGMKADSGPFHFSAEISKEKWEMSLSFPEDSPVPDLSTLPKVFTEGEKAVRSIVAATATFSSITDAGKVGALIKPNVEAVKSAVEAIGGIPGPRRTSGKSFGFKLGSPDPVPGSSQGIPPGFQATVVFTYWF